MLRLRLERAMSSIAKLPLLAALALFSGVAARAATVHGIVLDDHNQSIAHAQVLLRTLRGTEQRVITDANGRFSLTDVLPSRYDLLVLAPGYRSLKQAVLISDELEVRELSLSMKPGGFSDEVVVTASAVDLTEDRNPTAVTLIDAEQLQRIHAQTLSDALRFVPGLNLVQSGPRGSVTTVFSRGGEGDFNLVLVNGIQVNDLGGGFDFSNLPVEEVERIEIVRGPQSALFGSDAISSVISITTRKEDGPPYVELLTEGGSFGTRRYAASGRAGVNGWRVSAGASTFDTDGVQPNADFNNRAYSVDVGKSLRDGHEMEFHYLGNRAETGVPGPFGSNPQGLFPGIDLISRNEINRDIFALRYQGTLGMRFRHRIEGGFQHGNYDFQSPYGPSSSRQSRGGLRAQGEWSLSANHILAGGLEYEREEFKNSYVTDDSFNPLPISRSNMGYFVESIQTPSPRWLISTGMRLESIRTRELAANSYVGRPYFPERKMISFSPRLAASYHLRDTTAGWWGRTTIRSSLGKGMRSPDGFEISFTDNPRLNPERSTSLDLGFEQQLWGGRSRVRITYFYSRFYDLIVTLGGAAMDLSKYRSDNLANARSRGMEFEGTIRISSDLTLESHYTLQHGSLLALTGSATLAPAPFRVGQPLLRRPENSGALTLQWNRKRLHGTLTSVWRTRALDVEPNYGAFGGLYDNPGYLTANAGIRFDVTAGIALVAWLNNLTNKTYEESYGYPMLPRNFTIGLRWRIPAGR